MRNKIAAFSEVMMRLQVPGYELLSQANTLKYSFYGAGLVYTSYSDNALPCGVLGGTLINTEHVISGRLIS